MYVSQNEWELYGLQHEYGQGMFFEGLIFIQTYLYLVQVNRLQKSVLVGPTSRAESSLRDFRGSDFSSWQRGLNCKYFFRLLISYFLKKKTDKRKYNKFENTKVTKRKMEKQWNIYNIVFQYGLLFNPRSAKFDRAISGAGSGEGMAVISCLISYRKTKELIKFILGGYLPSLLNILAVQRSSMKAYLKFRNKSISILKCWNSRQKPKNTWFNGHLFCKFASKRATVFPLIPGAHKVLYCFKYPRPVVDASLLRSTYSLSDVIQLFKFIDYKALIPPSEIITSEGITKHWRTTEKAEPLWPVLKQLKYFWSILKKCRKISTKFGCAKGVVTI